MLEISKIFYQEFLFRPISYIEHLNISQGNESGTSCEHRYDKFISHCNYCIRRSVFLAHPIDLCFCDSCKIEMLETKLPDNSMENIFG